MLKPFTSEIQNKFPDCSCEILIIADDPGWDAFVDSVSCNNHVQSSLWGQVKNSIGWNPTRIIYKKNNEIIAGVQILTRNLPLGVSVHYVPRGPIYKPGYQDLASSLIQNIKKHIHYHWNHFLAVQPDVGGEGIIPCLQNNGFKCSKLELAPTATILIDLLLSEDRLLEKMKRQTRQNIRRSKREDITTRIGSEADLSTFYQLHLHTSQRQNFLPYKEEYFRKMWQIFSVKDGIQLILTEKNEEAVSSLLLLSSGDTVYSKIMGWSGAYPECRPNEALFWAAILWAKSRGFRFFDMEGVDREGAKAVLDGSDLPERLHHSPDFLKYGFGGKVILLPETYEYASNPFYLWCYRKMEFRIGGEGFVSKILDWIRKR